MQEQSYTYLGLQTGVCEVCGEFVETKVIEDNGVIFYLKNCAKHGEQKTKICIDIDYYLKCHSPQHQETCKVDSHIRPQRGCPYDCGVCAQHEQKICMAMVETTDDCNIQCKTCIAESSPGGKHYISLSDLQRIIESVKNVQGDIDLLMLSGGEPTIHPQLFDMIDLCKKESVKHTMIISNGVKIAEDEDFVKQLATYGEGIEVYLQFDSLRAATLLEIRGADVSEKIRRDSVKNLEKYGIHYTLVCVLKKGLNDKEISEIIGFAISKKFARGITFQPLKDIGRGSNFNKEANYLTLSEARQLVAETGYIPIDEMIPHPCNGTCISIGYLSKERKPITKHLFTEFEQRCSLKKLMYFLPYLDDEQTKYKDIFRIAIVSFLDKYNFTLEDVKRCCIDFISPDGKIVPFDTHYVYHEET